jgi:dual specificity phosphatase 12
MIEILPGLYLGNVQDSMDIATLQIKRIYGIINCTKDLPFHPEFKGPTMRIPVNDDGQSDAGLLEHLPSAIQAIDSSLMNGSPILVHCFAGIQRSAAVIAAYVMYKHKLDAPTAVHYIKSKKPEAFWGNVNFAGALVEWQRRL